MPNPIKYSTGSETKALRKGNFFFGTGDVGKGPSDITGYYQGVDVPSSGYTIYLYNENSSSNLSYHVANNDEELISFTNGIANTSYTTKIECLNYLRQQSNIVYFDEDVKPFVTDGLVGNYDSYSLINYPDTGTTVYDTSPNQYNASMQNGVGFSNKNFVFDGVNDRISISNMGQYFPSQVEEFSVESVFKMDTNSFPTGYSSIWSNYRIGVEIRNNATQIYIRYRTSGSDSWSDSYQIFSPGLEKGKYYHLVLTYKKINSTQRNSKVYINGELVSNATGGELGSYSMTNFFIGWSNHGGGWPFKGEIPITRIYNKELSSDEVLLNYETSGKRYNPLSVQYLVVAGGGGGDNFKGGGGGAGGLLTGTDSTLNMNTSYSVLVGGGGSAQSNGSNSVFNNITTLGGGSGSNSGGSGGGANGAHSGGGYGRLGGAGTPGQGNDGGATFDGITPTNNSGGGGGGGAGSVGNYAIETAGGDGGEGIYIAEYSSLGGYPAGWFAGGAGGGAPYNDNRGLGSNGGGGRGARNRKDVPNAEEGVINTGGGGGGGSSGGFASGYYFAVAGGSGIVILRIPDVYNVNFSSGVSWSLTKTNGYKYYKVTATSTTSETVSFS